MLREKNSKETPSLLPNDLKQDSSSVIQLKEKDSPINHVEQAT